MRADALGFAQLIFDPLARERPRQRLAAMPAGLLRSLSSGGRRRLVAAVFLLFFRLCFGLLLVHFQFRDEVLHVLAGRFQADGEEEELLLRNLLPLLSVTPLQQLFEDGLDAFEPPLIGFQLRG